MKKWFNAVVRYWAENDRVHKVHWIHDFFSNLVNSDKEFNECYRADPLLSSNIPSFEGLHALLPRENNPNMENYQVINNRHIPVFVPQEQSTKKIKAWEYLYRKHIPFYRKGIVNGIKDLVYPFLRKLKRIK